MPLSWQILNMRRTSFMPVKSNFPSCGSAQIPEQIKADGVQPIALACFTRVSKSSGRMRPKCISPAISSVGSPSIKNCLFLRFELVRLAVGDNLGELYVRPGTAVAPAAAAGAAGFQLHGEFGRQRQRLLGIERGILGEEFRKIELQFRNAIHNSANSCMRRTSVYAGHQHRPSGRYWAQGATTSLLIALRFRNAVAQSFAAFSAASG